MGELTSHLGLGGAASDTAPGPGLLLLSFPSHLPWPWTLGVWRRCWLLLRLFVHLGALRFCHRFLDAFFGLIVGRFYTQRGSVSRHRVNQKPLPSCTSLLLPFLIDL